MVPTEADQLTASVEAFAPAAKNCARVPTETRGVFGVTVIVGCTTGGVTFEELELPPPQAASDSSSNPRQILLPASTGNTKYNIRTLRQYRVANGRSLASFALFVRR